MRVSVLCSDRSHPVFAYLQQWCEQKRGQHEVELVERSGELNGGDLLLLISCAENIDARSRARYQSTLVVHASDLPRGRGWSPLVWQILEGQNDIVVSLIEAEDLVDTGAIWHQEVLHFAGHELSGEIHHALFTCELALMDFALDGFGRINPRQQTTGTPSYYRRRTPEDSRIDPFRSIADQFNYLRVADPARYPAFFDYLGFRYEIRLSKVGGASDESH